MKIKIISALLRTRVPIHLTRILLIFQYFQVQRRIPEIRSLGLPHFGRVELALSNFILHRMPVGCDCILLRWLLRELDRMERKNTSKYIYLIGSCVV